MHSADIAVKFWFFPQVLPLHAKAGPLSKPPAARALALAFWAFGRDGTAAERWPERSAGARAIRQLFGSDAGVDALRTEIADALMAFVAAQGLPFEA